MAQLAGVLVQRFRLWAVLPGAFPRTMPLMDAHTRFLAVFLAVVAVGCGGVAVFSIGVDPYGVFGMPPIAGLTTVKTLPDHVTKPYVVLRGNYDTLIVGSSRARDIFCPDLAALYPDEVMHCYNAGMAHADFPMARRMLVHANTVTPLRRAVIALDFFGFNTGYTPFDKTDAERFLGQPGRLPGDIISDVCRLLFSRDALAKGVETIAKSRPPAPPATPAVASPDSPGPAPAAAPADAPAPAAPPATPPVAHNRYVGFYPAVLQFYRNFAFANARTGVSSLEDFKSLLRYCRNQGIETSVLINPFHAVLYDVLREAGLWDTYLAWRQAVIALTAEANADGVGPHIALWDFSGYNAITTEPVLTADGLRDDLDYFADSFHYKRDVGNLMLRRMLAGEEGVPGFGRELTPADAAADAARFEAGHARYARDNAAYIDMVLGRAPRSGS
ncbi:hypothetical protein DVDV_0981 [Desulfovibrio sp. DV]|uniref:hypothetical protein n=1 Tax=Desulfovibrio sp. DV TaxID=1844708 RepID=UPI00094BAE43|nr:hypothetical protein [Desulfovibrio sp. DV]OLN29629.1 hypothetical protein DVDV_0981 [Desulfovibrio sp. DV]